MCIPTIFTPSPFFSGRPMDADPYTSRISKIIIPTIAVEIKKYFIALSLSFKNILDKIIERIQYEPTIDALIVEFEAIANT